jgi:hypothetical protein
MTPTGAIQKPDVMLYCGSQSCDGPRYFKYRDGSLYATKDNWGFGFLHYVCRNCDAQYKTYALAACWSGGTAGKVIKLGETPPFGPHTPARLITLIGPDRDLFLQGRRSENRGLGIGAFSYYRRVVENQKGRIIEKIAKVAEKLGAKPEVLKAFAAAAEETQFKKAVEEMRDGFPEALLVDGNNPMLLLHKALSAGLHDHTDEECLEIAGDIRAVLTDLADRLSQALKEEEELKKSVSRLMKRNTG